MAIAENKIAEEFIKAVKKSHPKLMESEYFANIVQSGAAAYQEMVADLNKDHKAGISLAQGHADTWAKNLGDALSPMVKEREEVEAKLKAITGVEGADIAARAELEEEFSEKLFKAGAKASKANDVMMAREFNVPETIRKDMAEFHGAEAKEFEKAGTITRFFKAGEKMRWGRVTAVGLGATAAGVGLSYLLSGDKKEEQPKTWAARTDASRENAAQRGV